MDEYLRRNCKTQATVLYINNCFMAEHATTSVSLKWLNLQPFAETAQKRIETQKRVFTADIAVTAFANDSLRGKKN